LLNKNTTSSVVKAMELGKRAEAAGGKLTILEGYPGPGTMTRSFIEDDNVERVIAMENHPSFAPWLEVSASGNRTLSDEIRSYLPRPLFPLARH
jgi:hypothetical protein